MPIGFAPGACGLSATRALAKPGAGGGRFGFACFSEERLVAGSVLAISLRCCWARPVLNVPNTNAQLNSAAAKTAPNRRKSIVSLLRALALAGAFLPAPT